MPVEQTESGRLQATGDACALCEWAVNILLQATREIRIHRYQRPKIVHFRLFYRHEGQFQMGAKSNVCITGGRRGRLV